MCDNFSRNNCPQWGRRARSLANGIGTSSDFYPMGQNILKMRSQFATSSLNEIK